MEVTGNVTEEEKQSYSKLEAILAFRTKWHSMYTLAKTDTGMSDLIQQCEDYCLAKLEEAAKANNTGISNV